MEQYYICQDCKKVFTKDQLAKWTEPHGEDLEGCPECFAPVVPGVKCEACGKLTAVKGDKICHDCAGEFIYRVKQELFNAETKTGVEIDYMKFFNEINDLIVEFRFFRNTLKLK